MTKMTKMMKKMMMMNKMTPIKTLQSTLAASLLLCTLTAAAQDKGNWRAVSTTARSITGDIGIAEEKVAINFATFTIARIRPLEKAEVSSIFDADSTAPGSASLYRLSIPGDKKFLHKNKLCGDEDTQWMVTYVTGHDLQMALFSGEKPPVFTHDAIANSTALCGTFSYTK
ncbi:hypothetical protein [Granulicella sp. L60]|uniref:hypothetical protein n=1 Tax=Granulicella sp. L60 TaxID=1641866 RepID=UPI0020B13E38|nr:hypothetical protein [Granulicella sp. L60]